MLLGPDAKHHLEHLALRNLYHGHLDMFRDEDLTMVKKSKIFQKVHAGYSVSKTNSIVSCTRFITSQTNQLISAVPIYLLSSLHGPFSAEQVLSVMMQVENWNQNYSSTFPTTDVFCFYEYEDSCHVVFDQLFGWTYQPICSTRFASPLSCKGEMGKGAMSPVHPPWKGIWFRLRSQGCQTLRPSLMTTTGPSRKRSVWASWQGFELWKLQRCFVWRVSALNIWGFHHKFITKIWVTFHTYLSKYIYITIFVCIYIYTNMYICIKIYF